MELIQSAEDKKAFQEKHGTYVDNVTVKLSIKGSEAHVTLGIFKCNDGTYNAFAGQDVSTAIVANGKNYSEAIAKILEVL